MPGTPRPDRSEVGLTVTLRYQRDLREQSPGRRAPAAAKARVTAETQETRSLRPRGPGLRSPPRETGAPRASRANDPRGALRPLAWPFPVTAGIHALKKELPLKLFLKGR